MSFVESFLINLAVAILDKYIKQGSAAFSHYLALKNELAANAKKSEAYNKVVNDSNATRADRRKVEDDSLS